MSEPIQQTIQTSFADGVYQIRFNRPEKLNAVTLPMWVAINAALDEAESRRDVRVILFSGAGKSFCTGADLAAFSAESLAEGVPSGIDNPGGRVVARLPHMTRTTIAAVQGHVVGFGFSLMLHCDLALAAPSAKFLLPFVRRGFVPEAGVSSLLPQRVGHLRASQMLLMGDALDAATAASWGLVNAVVDEQKLFDEALSWARRVAAQPPMALQRTRSLMREPAADIDQQLLREAELFTEQLKSEEVREAMAAFQEKRAPDFSRL